MSDNHPFKSRYGRHVREIKLMANPICEDCEVRGRARPAVTVHHIVEISEGGAPYDYNNMVSLCDAHHKARHSRKPAEIDPETGLPVGQHPWA